MRAYAKHAKQVAEQQREIVDLKLKFDDLEHGRGNFDFVQRTNHTISRLRDKLAERDSTIQKLREALAGLLETVKNDLAWDNDQPYQKLIDEHIAKAKAALAAASSAKEGE